MTLEKGKTYRVKLTGGAWTDAEFLHEETYGGFDSMNNRVWPSPPHPQAHALPIPQPAAPGARRAAAGQQKVKEIGGAL